MWLAQDAPGVPDAGDLKDLPTPVAILLLCLIALLAILYYFGGTLRSKLSRTPPEAAPNLTSGPTVATPAMELANEMANRYIADLQERNQILEDQGRRQDREIRQLRDEVEQLRLEVQRLKYRREVI